MDASYTTTIRVREATRSRLYAERKPLEGAAVESADDILTRLFDELDSLRSKPRRGSAVRAEAPVGT